MVKINPDHGAEIADGYDALRHSPNEPETKASYDALISETRQQYDKLTEGGLKVTKLKRTKQDIQQQMRCTKILHQVT